MPPKAHSFPSLGTVRSREQEGLWLIQLGSSPFRRMLFKQHTVFVCTRQKKAPLWSEQPKQKAGSSQRPDRQARVAPEEDHPTLIRGGRSEQEGVPSSRRTQNRLKQQCPKMSTHIPGRCLGDSQKRFVQWGGGLSFTPAPQKQLQCPKPSSCLTKTEKQPKCKTPSNWGGGRLGNRPS